MVLKRFKCTIEAFFNFKFSNFTSFDNFVKLMYEPRHSGSLGVIRILFGLLMMVDVLFERSGLHMNSRWGDPRDCHYPLISGMRPPDIFYMKFIYGLMWTGALGITVGYKFKISTVMFMIPYWYLLLLDKSYWNNHSYLFGLVSILLLGSSANVSYSVDAYLDKRKNNSVVPFWNYFIFRFQFFVLYFMAGLKKIDVEWLGGYAMKNLGTHWVFDPFRFILTSEQIDYIVVHLFGFLLDLTIGFWLLSGITRPYAMVICTAFHFMNSRLFSIGMFPYVCIATTPIFCDVNWPVQIQNMFNKPCSKRTRKIKHVTENSCNLKEITWKHKCVAALLLTYCGVQCVLPYSHSITKGYNNWTNGLYGYSWDMMVHSWNTALVVIRVTDNASGKEYFISPRAFTQNDRWNKHADMCVQYAHCLKENLLNLNHTTENSEVALPKLAEDISVYIDVWCSLNGRFQQRMFDSNYDLLKANWSVFKPVEWLLPLMSENTEFRNILKNVEKHVYSWSNHSDVLFIADFPGMHLENFLSTDLTNVSLTVLNGEVVYEVENSKKRQSIGIKLLTGSSYNVKTGIFHKIHTIGINPSLYMYTFVNQTLEKTDNTIQ